MGVTLDEWVDLVCRELQVERPDVHGVLDLARDVAHGIDRPAAPVTALLAGLAAADANALPAVLEKVRALLASVAEHSDGGT
ncbi:MAG: DUF6457 domain-containing protein [Actinomycetes bacterium]